MQFRRVGIYLVSLSTMLSFILFWVITRIAFSRGTSPSSIELTFFHLFILGVVVFGLALFSYGTRRGESEPEGSIGIILIIWGVLVMVIVPLIYYIDFTMRPWIIYDFWGYVQLAVWWLKGLLWFTSGIVFLKY